MDRKLSSSNDRGIGSRGSALLGFFCIFIMRGVDSNFDSDGPSTNIHAFESRNCFFLLFLSTNIDESIALALPGLSPAPANDAGRGDGDTGLSEESGKASIIDVESKVGNKEHSLGGLADRVFTSGARGTRGLGLADTCCFLASSRVISSATFSIRGRGTAVRGLAFGLDFRLTLKRGTMRMNNDSWEMTYSSLLLLLLGLGCFV
jgi:hypothetical protein